MRNYFETVVVGGGPAGSTAALTLARSGRQVLMVESSGKDTFKVGETLPPVAIRLLSELGLSAPLAADSRIPCWGNQSAWGSSELAATDFIADANGCGWHLDRAEFDATLRRIAHDAGSELWEQAKVTAATRSENAWELRVQRGSAEHRVRCDWVLDCTGRSSGFAKRLNVERADDDGLIACFAVFQPRAEAAPDQDCLTLIESVADGWWYTARLPNGNRVAAYFTDADLPSARASRTSAGFTALLQATRHLRSRMQSYAMGAPPVITRANSSRLQRLAGTNWLAAGDAATSFDPLSSQGIFHALYSGMRAAQAIDSHMRGDSAALQRYVERMEHVYSCYLQNRDAFYKAECRWNSEFWRRRRAERRDHASIQRMAFAEA